jgi:hypothetical protein
MATRGQIFGDSTRRKHALRHQRSSSFRIRAYSEAFTGHADKRIDSNEHGPNENRTVFEWLNAQPPYKDALRPSPPWNAFRRIIQHRAQRRTVFDGWVSCRCSTGTARATLAESHDADQHAAWHYKHMGCVHAPRDTRLHGSRSRACCFIGYERDRRVGATPAATTCTCSQAHQVDAFLEDLVEARARQPARRDKTTLIVTTDHGRGLGAKWTDHGENVDGPSASGWR